MFLFAVAAPNSIAATQTAWLLGMLFWLLRFLVWPRPRLERTPIDYPMFIFFVLTGVSSFLSYEPSVSIGKLRAASLFLIVYLFAENVHSARLLRMLTWMLIAASLVSVLYVFGQLAIGRGVKIIGVSAASPLTEARSSTRNLNEKLPIVSGDTIEKIDGVAVSSPDEIVKALDQSATKSPATIQIYRFEWVTELEVPRGHLLAGVTPEEQLGIQGWTRGRDRRATGFFNNWATYSESLQFAHAGAAAGSAAQTLAPGIAAGIGCRADRQGAAALGDARVMALVPPFGIADRRDEHSPARVDCRRSLRRAVGSGGPVHPSAKAQRRLL